MGLAPVVDAALDRRGDKDSKAWMQEVDKREDRIKRLESRYIVDCIWGLWQFTRQWR